MPNGTHRNRVVLVVLLVGMWTPSAAYPQIAVPKERTSLAVAAEGYLSNLEAFPDLYCRFIVSDYPVNSVADALAGRFGVPRMVNEGLLIRRGNKERYQLGCPPGVLAGLMKKAMEAPTQKGKNEASIPCMNADVLVNGIYKLDVAVGISVADVYTSDDGVQPRRSDFLSPVTPEDMRPPDDPGTLLREAVAGNIYGHFEGMKKIDGCKAMLFVIGESAQRIKHKFYLDPERGFLPVRHETLDPVKGTPIYLTLFTSFRSCSGERWYPERVVEMIGLWEGGPKPMIAREVKVTYLDADTPPRDDFFSIVIPEGYQVKNAQKLESTGDTGVYIEKSDHLVSAKDIPQLAKRLPELAEKRKKTNLAFQSREGTVSRRRWLVVTVALFLLSSGVLALWWKKRQRQVDGPSA